ncbi:unnamed protein product [Rhodiola kirilowii]
MESKGRVCVTGASGFLASWLIKRLLQSDYEVVGTVRDPANEKKLAHLWKLDGAKERLKLMRAELTEEGSFDEAVAGCVGVFHTASPVFGTVSDPMVNMVEPAVTGTLNVLRSCKRNPSLRRVVLTSSSSAVRARVDFDPNVPLDESSWSSVDLCQRFQIWYALSKTLAERAAWEFCSQNGIDLVTVLPSFVVGPSLPPELCSTASDILGLLKGETHRFEWHGRMGYVHIDDVALCHILVFEQDDARGRFLCSSDVLDNDALVALLSNWYPNLPIPKSFKQMERPYYQFNTNKITNLGLKFKSVRQMFDDCIASFVEQGYLKGLCPWGDSNPRTFGSRWPDIAHAVRVVSRFMSNSVRQHWEVVKWIFRYLKGSSSLSFVFESQSWVCRDMSMQIIVVTLTAERAHLDIFTHMESVIHIARNPVYHARTKHIQLRYHFIRSTLEDRVLVLEKFLGSRNSTDMLTKVVLNEKLKLCAASNGLLG